MTRARETRFLCPLLVTSPRYVDDGVTALSSKFPRAEMCVDFIFVFSKVSRHSVIWLLGASYEISEVALRRKFTKLRVDATRCELTPRPAAKTR